MLSGVKVKVCGMKDSENIREVSALHPDYMGFIFYEASPRYVGNEFEIAAEVDSSIHRVGVFVNHTVLHIKEVCAKHQLHFAQLHGDESVAVCESLKSESIRVIKVFRVDDDFDFTNTKAFESVADYFLFDTRGRLYGGNSIPFDWELLKKYNQAVPFFLSGGIQESNLRALKNVADLNIHAIDINSGVEDRPGIKNVSKVSEIINQLSL
jgi:phosphoribosylanthranilate isomerase